MLRQKLDDDEIIKDSEDSSIKKDNNEEKGIENI